MTGYKGEVARLKDTVAYARNAAVIKKKTVAFDLLPKLAIDSYDQYSVEIDGVVLDTYDVFKGVRCSANASDNNEIDRIEFSETGEISLYYDSVPLGNPNQDAFITISDSNNTTSNIFQIYKMSGKIRGL